MKKIKKIQKKKYEIKLIKRLMNIKKYRKLEENNKRRKPKIDMYKGMLNKLW